MYILGVDGGGTKIEFLLTNLEGQEVLRFVFEESSNLKYVGAQAIINLLDKGLAKICDVASLDQIAYAYLGIAECGCDGVGKGREDIVTYLQSKLSQFELADDQYSVFRAKSPTPYGVLANAGTGSNINNFCPDSEQTYKSVGIGGRDFGKLILAQIKFGAITKNSQIYTSTKQFLGKDPIEYYDSLSPEALVFDSQFPKLPRVLIKGIETNPTLLEEMKMFEIVVATRWSQKLASYCAINFGYGFEEEFDLVLAGSLWRWENMRYLAIQDFKRSFPNAQIHYDNSKQPVNGAIIIATEKLQRS